MKRTLLAAAAALCILAAGVSSAAEQTPDPKPLLGSGPAPACVCGDQCECDPGTCPGKCTVLNDIEHVVAVADAPCYIDPRTGRQVCPRQVVTASIAAAKSDSLEVDQTAPRRGILARVVSAIRNREPIFPNRPKLRGGFLRGCGSCG